MTPFVMLAAGNDCQVNISFHVDDHPFVWWDFNLRVNCIVNYIEKVFEWLEFYWPDKIYWLYCIVVELLKFPSRIIGLYCIGLKKIVLANPGMYHFRGYSRIWKNFDGVILQVVRGRRTFIWFMHQFQQIINSQNFQSSGQWFVGQKRKMSLSHVTILKLFILRG